MARRRIDERWGQFGIALAGGAIGMLALNLAWTFAPPPQGTLALIVLAAAVSFVGGLLGALAYGFQPGTKFFLMWRLARLITAALIVVTIFRFLLQPAAPAP